MIRKHIFFTGRVQGVGFRYQSAYYARSLGLTGWVRNLSDGRVEMEVQGRETLINQLLISLRNAPYIRIEEVECTNIPLQEKEQKFSTKFTY
ncbi:acylphosphatase [Lachnoclostridium sp. An131]|jgi:acylphosphatase|uniref:acylphosphatase n=1 Tax=Lachnoclostridium sp. An131 TaxID=1965555 RepID=UPI000B36BF76|nr:acylphosphatase [Lachnoclostridium sp. An131]OUQ27408.1 acylphosphatase [Lachnoclostridium sp. An131]